MSERVWQDGYVQTEMWPDGDNIWGDVVLKPGDVIIVDNPHRATVAASMPKRSPHQDVLLNLPTDAQARTEYPIMTGLLDYFPAACAAVAQLSLKATQQHHPGEPMHWDRHKSKDHADKCVRHMMERGTVDADGVLHSVKAAWRALAQAQEDLERIAGFVPAGEG